MRHLTRSLLLTAGAVVLMLRPASGQITGFNDLSGWTYNQPDGGSPADLPDANTIHLTTGNAEARSIFYNTPQNITQFTTSFTYRATYFNPCLVGQGIALVFQNSPGGVSAVGNGNGGLGYTGITQSAALVLWADTGPGLTYAGFYKGGNGGSGSESISPANAFNYRDLQVTAKYSGQILNVTIDDPITAGVDFTRNYIVGDLASTIGSQTAYVGFTASTGDGFGNGGASQYISNFHFSRISPVPGPSALVVGLIGSMPGLGVLLRRRRKRCLASPA